MPTLRFYIMGRLLRAFVATLAVLVGAIGLGQSLRLMDIVVQSGSGPTLFAQLVLLALPALLPPLMPPAALAAVLFVHGRLRGDSEWAAMQAAGLSPQRLAVPALTLGLGCFALSFCLSAFLAPLAERKLDALRRAAQADMIGALLRPGTFHEVAPGLVAYWRTRDRDGSLHDIFIRDDRERPITAELTAKTGVWQQGEDGAVWLSLQQGRQSRFHSLSGRAEWLDFDRYVVTWPAVAADARQGQAKTQALPLRRQSLGDLAQSAEHRRGEPSALRRIRVEMHTRFLLPALCLGFVCIGLAAMTAEGGPAQGDRRTAMAMALAVLIGLLCQALFLAAAALAQRSTPAFVLIHLIPLMACAAFPLRLLVQRRGRAEKGWRV
jgi:lipopolysaccharide export system permease protein